MPLSRLRLSPGSHLVHTFDRNLDWDVSLSNLMHRLELYTVESTKLPSRQLHQLHHGIPRTVRAVNSSSISLLVRVVQVLTALEVRVGLTV